MLSCFYLVISYCYHFFLLSILFSFGFNLFIASLQNEITLQPVHNGYRAADSLYFENINVFGQMSTPARILVNAKEISMSDYEYDVERKVGLLKIITDLNIKFWCSKRHKWPDKIYITSTRASSKKTIEVLSRKHHALYAIGNSRNPDRTAFACASCKYSRFTQHTIIINACVTDFQESAGKNTKI